MASLEEALIPTLKLCHYNWKRYLDDSHACVEPPKAEYILKQMKHLSCGHQLLNWTGEKQWIKLFRRFYQKN